MMKKEIKEKPKKEKLNFPNMDSLQPVVNIINEASITLGDPTRTIKDSPLVEVFAAALGSGSGAGVSFMALYGLGTVGLSAAGITSALAAEGQQYTLHFECGTNTGYITISGFSEVIPDGSQLCNTEWLQVS